MLVLSRRIGESIVVPGCGVVFTVLEVGGRRVRVGVVAPPEVDVHRGEVWDRLHPEKERLAEDGRAACS